MARSYDLAQRFDSMVFCIEPKSAYTDLFARSWQLAHLFYIGNRYLVHSITLGHASPGLFATTGIPGMGDVKARVLTLRNDDVLYAGSDCRWR